MVWWDEPSFKGSCLRYWSLGSERAKRVRWQHGEDSLPEIRSCTRNVRRKHWLWEERAQTYRHFSADQWRRSEPSLKKEPLPESLSHIFLLHRSSLCLPSNDMHELQWLRPRRSRLYGIRHSWIHRPTRTCL